MDRSLGLRVHDYFIARSIDLLKPGALAAFVTSSGTMDKVDATAREHIAKTADLIAAIRLPEGKLTEGCRHGCRGRSSLLQRKLGEPASPNNGSISRRCGPKAKTKAQFA